MRYCLHILLVLLLLAGVATAQSDRPRVAVVLSGGGAKGVAHIGALKVIEEAGIPVDIICGTSMGSLIGALYSIGYSTDFLDSLVRAQDWTFLLSDRTAPSDLTLRQREEQNTYAFIRGLDESRPQKGGLIRGRNLMRLFRELCQDYLDSISFDSMPIPYACVATDIVTNSEVDFHSGSLIHAMRASMAIPGVFTPVRMGDKVLVDGGLRNNYPADLARAMGADIIIGVTVQSPLLSADEIGDALSVMMQVIDINTKNKYQDNLSSSDVVMEVDVHGYSAASFFPSAIDTLLARGESEARRHWDELVAISKRIKEGPVQKLQQTETNSIAWAVSKESWRPRQEGNDTLRRHTSIPIVSVGFRFDTEEMGALQLNGKLPLSTGLPMSISGTIRLGRRLVLKADYSLFTHHTGFNPTLSYAFHNNDIDLYTHSLRTFNIRYYQHTVQLSPLDLRLKLFDIHAGARWDYFDYYGQLLSSSYINASTNDDHYISYFASADLNTEDHWYFPTKGMRFHADYSYHTDNLITFDGDLGLNELKAHLRVNLTVARRITLQPMFYGRIISGSNLPLAFTEAIGGEWFGHTVEQQMPLAGIGHMEYVGNQLAAAQLQVQMRILTNHYVLLRAAAGVEDNSMAGLLSTSPIYGMQLGYSYNTLFGPIDLRLGYSNRTKVPYFMFNIGHIF